MGSTPPDEDRWDRLIANLDSPGGFVKLAGLLTVFLLVALLQNSQTRNDQATQHKLNAIADGLADLMQHLAAEYPDSSLDRDMMELRAAVGLEAKESTSRNAK